MNSNTPQLFRQAVIDSFKKLNPRDEIKNLVMFVVWLGSIWTTVILVHARPVQPVQRPDLLLAVVHLPVRQFRRGHGHGTQCET